MRELHTAARGSKAWKDGIHDDVMREPHDEFIDDHGLSRRSGDPFNREIGRPLPDEVVSIEITKSLFAFRTGDYRHVDETWSISHGLHRSIGVSRLELCGHVRIEYSS